MVTEKILQHRLAYSDGAAWRQQGLSGAHQQVKAYPRVPVTEPVHGPIELQPADFLVKQFLANKTHAMLIKPAPAFPSRIDNSNLFKPRSLVQASVLLP